jgi:hypothetical protein
MLIKCTLHVLKPVVGTNACFVIIFFINFKKESYLNLTDDFQKKKNIPHNYKVAMET